MTNYNDGKWHGWNGGKCPVHPESEVEIQTYGDDGGCGTDVASSFLWGSEDVYGNRIIAFRVIKEYKEPREFWLVLDADDHIATGFDNMDGAIKIANKWPGRTIIHVREVLE